MSLDAGGDEEGRKLIGLREADVSPYKILICFLFKEHLTRVKRYEFKSPDSRIRLALFLYSLTICEDKSLEELGLTLSSNEHLLSEGTLPAFYSVVNCIKCEGPSTLISYISSLSSIIDSSHSVVIHEAVGHTSPLGLFLRQIHLSLSSPPYSTLLTIHSNLLNYIRTNERGGGATNEERGGGATNEERGGGVRANEKGGLTTNERRGGGANERKGGGANERRGGGANERRGGGANERRGESLVPNQRRGGRRNNEEAPTLIKIDGKENVEVCKNESKEKERVSSPLSLVGLSTFCRMGKIGFQPHADFSNILLNSQLKKIKNLQRVKSREEKRREFENFKKRAVRELRPLWKNKNTPQFPPTPNISSPVPKKSSRAKCCSSFVIISPLAEESYFLKEEKCEKKSKRGRSKKVQNIEISMDLSERINLEKYQKDIKEWEIVKWQGTKIVERTLGELMDSFNYISKERHSSQEISCFVSSILKNPSTSSLQSQIHYLNYLSSVEMRDVYKSSSYLRTCYDYKTKMSNNSISNSTPYATFNLSLLYDLLGYKSDVRVMLEEAFKAAHSSLDSNCLNLCNFLWTNLEGVENMSLSEFEIILNEKNSEQNKNSDEHYLNSLHLGLLALSTSLTHSLPSLNGLQNIWKAFSTASDFENNESFLLIALANFFLLRGLNDLSELFSELILLTSDCIRWPVVNFSAALYFMSISQFIKGNIKFSKMLIHDYGSSLFGNCSSFSKEKAIYEATVCYYASKPLPHQLISTLKSYGDLDYFYWDAYNQIRRKNWDFASFLIKELWESVMDKNFGNYDLSIRILLLEAEFYCGIGETVRALEPLFSAHKISTRISSDFYTILTQIYISTVQNFLRLDDNSYESLNLNKLLAASSYSLFLYAKIIYLKIKNLLSHLHLPPNISLRKTINFCNLPLLSHLLLNRGGGGNNLRSEEEGVTKRYNKMSVMRIEKDVYEMLENGIEIYEKYGNNYHVTEGYLLYRKLGLKLGNSTRVSYADNKIKQNSTDFDLYDKFCVL